jgi:hypothetical protein
MITNADITLYSRQTGADGSKYARHVIIGANWQGEQRATVSDRGLNTADSMKVYIPLSSAEDTIIKKGDIIARGVTTHDMSNGGSLAALRMTGADAYEVISTRRRDNGSRNMRHWQIEAV